MDPAHSGVHFTVRILGIAKVRGRFSELEAALHVGESLNDVRVSATIATASLDTGHADRDAHVRSADLLDVEKRPTMAFSSTGITGAGEDYSMDGELTIGDVTRPVSLAVEFGGLVDGPLDGIPRAGFEATGEIHLPDFGFDFNRLSVGNTVRIELDMQFLAPQDGQAAT
ncbi:Polyisoprenoid-binding protein YceI [Actinacidiphila rubida]|uniref:Polyisoprenoid-binding protein YceI n=2 Tax=Actinacidiphila rubida TaxID=310780 RepID=A0A1H8LKR0_9ACTN|nr:Polyisoprenoid-binding protein YceI [Actinacidiphila rubida]